MGINNIFKKKKRPRSSAGLLENMLFVGQTRAKSQQLQTLHLLSKKSATEMTSYPGLPASRDLVPPESLGVGDRRPRILSRSDREGPLGFCEPRFS